MNIKPLSPTEVLTSKKDVIPDFVIIAVNNMLKKHYNGSRVVIKQDDIINEIIRLNPALTRQGILDEKYLDFEHVFKSVGWDVTYDKPGYCEGYSANFIFEVQF